MLWQINLFGPTGQDPTTINPEIVLELGIRLGEIALSLIGVVVIVYIVIAGIQYVTAGGDLGKQAEARKALTASIIGLVIVILALVGVQALLHTLKFNANILNNDPLGPLRKLFNQG